MSDIQALSSRRQNRRLGYRALGLILRAACLFAGVWGGPALAQDSPDSNPGSVANTEPLSQLFTGFWHRSNLLGDIGGLRNVLGRYGVTFSLQETSEVLGNVSGGIKQGATYDGLTQASLQLDTGKALDWNGGTFNVSALQIHGRSLSQNYLDNLQTASGIEADRATRLWELWFAQDMLEGKANVKLGQQSLDQEFIVSQNAALFVNTMFGWPMLPSADLPSGGPAYPLSSLGARLKVQPLDPVTVLAGIFDDNPAGPGAAPLGPGDPQRLDPSGTNFRLTDGALVIAEAQFAVNQPSLGEMQYGNKAPGLPGTYRLGAWYDSGGFHDQEFDNTGLSLADPSSSGIARRHRGNYSIYAIMDQMLWRPDPESPQNLNLFGRIMGAPDDRNLISLSLNAGLTLKDPVPGRDNDTAGIGMGYAKVSNRAGALDRDTGFFTGTAFPVRSGETFIEVTYQYQLTPWWQVQPDFQYTFIPGGGILNPDNPARRIGNEAVLGVRTNITF